KSGCAAFGHSCFGAHGKRALGVANPEDVLPENEAHLVMEDDLSALVLSFDLPGLTSFDDVSRGNDARDHHRLRVSESLAHDDVLQADHQQDEQMLEDDLRFRNVRLRPHQWWWRMRRDSVTGCCCRMKLIISRMSKCWRMTSDSGMSASGLIRGSKAEGNWLTDVNSSYLIRTPASKWTRVSWRMKTESPARRRRKEERAEVWRRVQLDTFLLPSVAKSRRKLDPNMAAAIKEWKAVKQKEMEIQGNGNGMETLFSTSSFLPAKV
ncbi:unnamed protein product, partial [Notodromas monacha]